MPNAERVGATFRQWFYWGRGRRSVACSKSKPTQGPPTTTHSWTFPWHREHTTLDDERPSLCRRAPDETITKDG
jgi:hypothetical protein